ncbi:MAG: sigma-54-dependent Fis family transcriptional regulator [Aquificae bacterium]|nr:sigma-54-dependent Fis family transcriptional regulator [Aquificota bacterium]
MKALVFDDERTIRKVIEKVLKKENLQVKSYETGKDAVDIIKKENPQIVFLDISLPDADGMEILKSVVSLENRPYIIMISGHDEYNYLIEAMKLGAFDYIPKPFDIEKIRKVVQEIKEIISAKTVADTTDVDIIGKSPAMKEVFKIVGRASASNQPVLITGESGTGKEVVAKLIHKYSNRADKPFIAINCAAIPSGLIESELFGYEKGAFTGADRSRQGKFQAADGGTIFLDEISELPLEAQGKLLRALQDMEITPVGSTKSIKVDVRVIAATNKNLVKLIAEEKFREDLFYRLSVIEINLPPLRERKEDIPELVELFTKQALKIHGLQKGGFTPEAVELLKQYDFPGNIRELRNLVHKLIAIYRERPITPDLIKLQIQPQKQIIMDWQEGLREEVAKLFSKGSENIYPQLIQQAEKVVIQEVLKYTKGNISEASKYLGIHRNTVHKKIEELEIERNSKEV